MGRKELNRIGLLGATSYIIGSVIGSGIFVSPKGILEHTGSVGLSLLVWVLSAILASLTAINYIELGTSIPESGAEFAYVMYVGWYPIAFSFLWLASLIQCSCSGATLALTFGEYIMVAIDPLVCLNETDRKYAVLLLSYGILCGFQVYCVFCLVFTALLNMFSLSRFAARIQMASMVAKVTALIMIIVIGLYYMIFRDDTQHFSKSYAFKGSHWSVAQIVLALYQGNWAYGGYTILNYGIEDIQIENFKRTVPLAVLFGLFVSAVVYVLANIAYFAVLTPQEILDSSAVATTFAQETVGSFSYAMPALIAVLMLGSVNAEIFAWSRYIQAGARKGMMPTMLTLIHPENDSPRTSVFLHMILSMGFCLIGNVYILVNYLTIVALLSTMFSVAALVHIKWSSIPVSTNAVKFNIFWPILNFVVNFALLVIPVVVEPVQSAIGFGLFVFGIACYFGFVRPATKPRFLTKLDEISTYICQQLFWTVIDSAPEYKKETDPKITGVGMKKSRRRLTGNGSAIIAAGVNSTNFSRRATNEVQELSIEKL